MPFRILHVDDDSDIRVVVEISLGLDPAFTLMNCSNGIDALALANDWAPDLILCDVMMAGMDGPGLLMRLRENPRTARIPVLFMTADVQTRQLKKLKLLGAVGVVTKPFDVVTLPDIVRSHLRTAKSATAAYDFAERLRKDAATLLVFQKTNTLWEDSGSSVPEGLQSCAHKLAGAAGVFDFPVVSAAASELEDTIIERRAGRGTLGGVKASLAALLECIEHQTPRGLLASTH